jgi:hypothetical protein
MCLSHVTFFLQLEVRECFIGPNLLTATSPSMKNPITELVHASDLACVQFSPCSLCSYKAREWFIGPNLLTMTSPPMKNPKWLLHRALTSAVNTDRNGIESTMGSMMVQAITIISNLSRDLKKKHGTVIDIAKEYEHIIVSATLSAVELCLF